MPLYLVHGLVRMLVCTIITSCLWFLWKSIFSNPKWGWIKVLSLGNFAFLVKRLYKIRSLIFLAVPFCSLEVQYITLFRFDYFLYILTIFVDYLYSCLSFLILSHFSFLFEKNSRIKFGAAILMRYIHLKGVLIERIKDCVEWPLYL